MVNKVKGFFLRVGIHIFEAIEATVDLAISPAPYGLVVGIMAFIAIIVSGDIGQNRELIHNNTTNIGNLIDIDFQTLDLIIDTRNAISEPLDTLEEVNNNRTH